ncbi:hypothetical protein QBC40DRAFT_304378 [Triangularia verruculosa]|uniref:Uncharacterized protein n=1 Tax=Triangularia verruculosa TaxID=2587418 RepID=A0AAN6XMB0_9PEZI|nr:hypothetical protein QBC40DRAFT_304378 [Triangularia verruculosa]
MPLSKPIPMDEYLNSNNENMYGEDVPRPIAQASASYTMPLRTLFDARDDDALMNDEERRFFNRRYQTFVDNATNYIATECQTQADINGFFIRRLAHQDAVIDRLERSFHKTLAAAVENEIDLFLGNKPTSERIRGINRRMNEMQLELKTFKAEVKSHPEFSGHPDDIRAKKAAMAAAAGVPNQSKKRKKVAGGVAVPVGEGAGQGVDGLDLLHEQMLAMASRLRQLRDPESTSTPANSLVLKNVSDITSSGEEGAKMHVDGGAGEVGSTDSDMADDEASSQIAPSSPAGITGLTRQFSGTGLSEEEEEKHAARTHALFATLPVRAVSRNGGHGGDGGVNF